MNENGARVNLLFTGDRESRSQLLLAIGLILVDFFRHFAIAGLLATGLAPLSHEVAAQSLDSEISGVFGAGSEIGYMGLGGGLSKAVAKRSKTKPSAAARHSSHEPALRAAAARYEPTPVFFVFQTLDHSGFNISRVGVRAPSYEY